MINSRIQALVVSVLFACALPSPLAAQATDPSGQDGGTGAQQGTEGEDDGSARARPYRGLFGLGDSGRTGAAISGTLFGAYDDDIASTLPGRPVDPRYQRSGWYSGANGQVSFNWRGERAAMNGWAAAGTSYYPDFDKPLVPTYRGGIGYSRPIGERNAVRLSESVHYSPYFLNGFFADIPQLDELPNAPVVSDPSLDVSGNSILRSSTTAGFSRQLSRASTLNAGYGYTRSDYSNQDRSYESHNATVLFLRQLTRHANLRLGYGYRTVMNRVGLPGEPELSDDMHDFIVGVDYNRSIALAMSRRTRLAFSTGTSFISGSQASGVNFGNPRPRSRFYVTGTANLVHEMGRTWRAAAAYRRSASFSELVLAPVVSDSLTATLSGLLGRRNEVSLIASASNGHVGEVRTSNDFTSYTASAQLRRALTRHLAAHVSYILYRHDFDDQVLLPTGFPQSLNRRGVNFGLNAWLPLR